MRHYSPFLVAFCVACAERPVTVIERDSAGIDIVEIPHRILLSVPTLSVLLDSPTVNIGGTGIYGERYLTRVTSALRTRAGNFVIANSGSGEILVFDAQGRLSRTIGRRGNGPGEFQDISSAVMIGGDSVFAYDGLLRRVSVFTEDGAFVRTFSTVVQGVVFPDVKGVFRDGSLLVASLGLPSDERAEGLYRDTTLLFRASGSQITDSLGRFPGDERFLQYTGRGVSLTPLPFGKKLQYATGDSVVYLGSGDTYEILSLSMRGEAQRIIRMQTPPATVTPALIADYKDKQTNSNLPPEIREINRRRIESVPFPSQLPAYSQFQASEGGGLWVRAAVQGASSTWHIFDHRGLLTATAALPTTFTVTHLDRDMVVGVWRDSLGVEFVRAYGLR
jgi:hypothetical protein